MPCWSAAFISRLPPTRRASSRRRMAKPSWKRRCKRRAPHFSRSTERNNFARATRSNAAMDILIRELTRAERPALLAHFLALDADDRRLRFGAPQSERALRQYV